MKKKTYKALQNRLLRAHKAWITENILRIQAESKTKEANAKAETYKRRFRSIGSNVETIDPGPGKIKMLKWTIPAEVWGDYLAFDKALVRFGEEKEIEKHLKEELTKAIAKGLLESDIVQYIISLPDITDPLERYGTFGGKLYVVPWEYMANRRKTIELMQKAEDE